MVAKSRYGTTDINSALDSIASAFDFDADALIDYAAIDPHGGYHPQEGGDGFPIGSIWRVEGQVLYALVRHQSTQFENLRVLELGTHYGCSATHTAQALHDADNGGKLTCVDLNGAAGNMIPAELLPYVELVTGDMFEYLEAQPSDVKFDFIFEDGFHGADDVERVWRAAWNRLAWNGVIVSHDAEHFIVGTDVREGIARAGYFGQLHPARTYLIEPSDCGLAVWRKMPPADGLMGVPAEAPVKRKNDEVDADFLPTLGELLNPPDLSAMTIAELRDYAAKRDISLTGLRTKGEIIAAIEAVQS